MVSCVKWERVRSLGITKKGGAHVASLSVSGVLVRSLRSEDEAHNLFLWDLLLLVQTFDVMVVVAKADLQHRGGVVVVVVARVVVLRRC